MAAPVPPNDPGPWLGWIATAVGALGAGAVAVWKWVSNNKLNQAGSNAQLDIINMLTQQVATERAKADAERARADAYQKASDAAMQQISALREQVSSLEARIAQLSQQQSHLANTVQASMPTGTPT